jgi:hypothetical protein
MAPAELGSRWLGWTSGYGTKPEPVNRFLDTNKVNFQPVSRPLSNLKTGKWKSRLKEAYFAQGYSQPGNPAVAKKVSSLVALD